MNSPSPDPGSLNIHDIAKAAGVSVGTVSRALNNRPEVAPATRRRIADIAKRLGYRPNKLLGALAAKRFKGHPAARALPVALLTRGGAQSLGRSWGAQFHEVCERQGFEVTIFETLDHPKAAALSRQLYHRGFSGLFFSRVIVQDDYWSGFDFSPFALISMDEGFARLHPGIPLVRHTPFASVARAWQALRDNGYRRISAVLFDPPERSLYTMRILACCRYYLMEMPARDRVEPFLVPGFDRGAVEQAKATLPEWIRSRKIEALILHSAFADTAREADCPHIMLGNAGPDKTGLSHAQSKTMERAVWLMTF